LAVDQEQLQLGADRGWAGAEAGPLQQPTEGQQALLQSLLEPLVVDRVEPLPVDRKAHRLPPAGSARRLSLPAQPARI